MNTPKANPRNRLLPYQRRWADDNSRWKFGLMSRQTGKDFCSAEQASGLSHSASLSAVGQAKADGRMAGSEEHRAGTPAATGETPVPQHANGPWSCHFVDIYTAVKEGFSTPIGVLGPLASLQPKNNL